MGDQSGHNTNVLISGHSFVWRMILDHDVSMFYSGSLFNFLAKHMIYIYILYGPFEYIFGWKCWDVPT